MPTRLTPDPIREHDKDLLLKVLFYYMDADLRRKLMEEVPQAYNNYCESQIVAVVRTDDLRKEL